MASDANVVLQASVTKTDTFNGSALDLKNGTNDTGLYARVIVTSASNASGSATVTFSVDHSADNSTWYTLSSGADQIITTTTTATPYEIYIPVNTDKRYIRLTATFSATTGTPTATYQAALVPTKP